MKEKEYSLARGKEEFLPVVKETDQKTLAVWAIDCAERVLPYFEDKFLDDTRPRDALKTLQEWIDTGVFSMKVIRKASLDSHASARDVAEDSPARSAARACGQAVATAHVPTHAIGAAIYAQQAIHRMTQGDIMAVIKEKTWQQRHLVELRERK